MKYCLPIIKESKEEILQIISENPDYDFYEIWLSYIKDLDNDFVWKISQNLNGKLIFLFRKQNLENSDLEKDLREKIIKLLENSDNFLDLDINDQKEDLEFVKKEKLGNKLIVSLHDYKGTPNLDGVLEDMEEFNPEIYKVATFCKTEEDSLKLLTLLLELKEKGKKFIAKQEDIVTQKSHRFIILGMGEKGIIVRIFGALWGNEFNFAPRDEKDKSAEGQLTREKLEGILGEINYAGK